MAKSREPHPSDSNPVGEAREAKSAARKTSATPTKIFTIGALCKLSAAEQTSPQMKLIFDQLFEAFRYRRRLVDIENERRREFRALRRTLHPRLDEMETEVDTIEAEISELRKGLKTKKERTTPKQLDLLTKIAKLKDRRRDLYPQIKAAFQEVNDTHFKHLDELFASEKKARLERAAKKKGVASLGPNDPVRRDVMDDLDEYMTRQRRGVAWLAKRQIDLKAEKANKVARSETGCNPGTYQAVEEAVGRAKKDARGGDLRHKHWDRTGRIGIQLTGGKGLTVERALSGQDEKLKIEIQDGAPLRKNKSDVFHPSHSRPVDLHAKERAARAKRFAKNPELRPYRKLVTARMKLSGHVKNAVYLDIRGVLHRPLPEDGVIKWAFLNVDRVGYDMFCELQLVMESETFALRRAGAGSDKRLAINFGWRSMPDGSIRVATTWDGRSEGHITLDPKLLETERLSQRLIGYSDEHFDETRDQVIAWLGELSTEDRKDLLPLLRAAVPERMRKDLRSIEHIRAYMAKWRGHERLAKFANVLRDRYLERDAVAKMLGRWRKHRLDRKEDLFASYEIFSAWAEAKGVLPRNSRMALFLETWRAKDRHLVNWARHSQTKLRRHRREIYRRYAAQWARDYGQIVIEKWNKSETARTPKYENDSRNPRQENASAIRQFAGIYACGIALREKFGPDLLEKSADRISMDHFGCGGTSTIAPGESLTPALECAGCGKHYDQDVNAARHLWHRAFDDGADSEQQVQKQPKKKRERSGDAQPAGSARGKGSRRSRKESLATAAE